MKKCKVCREPFEPFNSLQVACSPKCALRYAESNRKRSITKKVRKYRSENKTIPELIQEAQKAFNKYIRTRDEGKPCICCGRVYADDSGQWDAGHYRTVGAARHLRFNTLNVWRQSKYCNKELGGNYVEYRKRLIEKLGEDRVLRLEHDNNVRRFDREYLIRLKAVFTRREKHLRKLRGLL